MTLLKLALTGSLLCLACSLSPASASQAPLGAVSGAVLDKATQRPLVGVNVYLLDAKRGAMADSSGRFLIERIPVGSYHLRFSMVGYTPLVRTEVLVKPGRTTAVHAELEVAPIGLEAVVVRADYFAKDADVSTSSQSFNSEEIRRAPGGAGDLNRVMMSMPGVVSTTDQVNELVVRGGDPAENLTLYDHVELANSNHFAALGETGGPIGMVNLDFVQEAQFYTGGFPARYGDKLSSVLDVRLREGGRKLSGVLDLNMAGAGGMVEGPLGDKASGMFSYHKSYINLIKGAVGLTAVPYYQSFQGKLSYDPNLSHKLWLVGIGGIDHIEIKEPDGYSTGLDYVHNKTHQYAVGVNWRALWGEKTYSLLTLSQANQSYYVVVKDTVGGDVLHTDDSWENTTHLGGEFSYAFDARTSLVVGGSYKRVGFRYNTRTRVSSAYDSDSFEEHFGADSLWSYLDADSAWDLARARELWEHFTADSLKTLTLPELVLRDREHTAKGAGFVHLSWRPVKRAHLKAGLRYDTFRLTQQGGLGDRFALTYDLGPSTALNLSTGLFHQAPPYTQVSVAPENRHLKDTSARHYVAGVERLLREDLRLTAEVYRKDYRYWPISRDDTTRVLVSTGSRTARGMDLFLHKKLTGNVYGLVSYSLCWAETKEPDKEEYYSAYDSRHVLTLSLGYRRSDLWELSAKWRYMSGRPYTPLLRREPLPDSDWGLWDAVYDEDHPHSARYPEYHRLDVRYSSHKSFKTWNLVAYVEVENVYARKNVWAYQWNAKRGEMETIHQFDILPVGGLAIEF